MMVTGMKFGLLGGGQDGEHNGVSFVDIFRIFATLGELIQHYYFTEITCLWYDMRLYRSAQLADRQNFDDEVGRMTERRPLGSDYKN